MENRAATAWASAQSNAATLAADLDCGDNVSYDAAEDMGEQVFRELQTALRRRDLVLVDDGDGHDVRAIPKWRIFGGHASPVAADTLFDRESDAMESLAHLTHEYPDTDWTIQTA